MIKRFIQFYKPYRKLFYIDMSASLMVAVIGMSYPIITRILLNDFIPNQKFDLVVLFGVILLILYALRMLMRFIVQYYGHIMGVKMQQEMRRSLFKKLQSLPFDYYDNHETGQIMTRMTNDLMDITELAHHGPETLIVSSVMLIGSFIYLSSINFILTLIVFSCVPILVFISLTLRKNMIKAFKESRKSVGVINANLSSSISGIRVTKSFNNSDVEMRKFEVGNQSYAIARSKAYKAMALFQSSTQFITDVFNVVCLIAGGIFLYRGEITFADYSTFIISINLFITPVTQFINFMEQFQNGFTGFERFIEMMDLEEENPKLGMKELENVENEIEFKDVCFSYQDELILNHLNLKIKANQTLALVGPSGGGKTTICHLIPNFYEINQGEILVDGISLNEIQLSSLRDKIGIVAQDVFLFSGTIRENILYGRLDASEEEIIQACIDANIYDFIHSLPDGFDTEIGERGIRLSGGQKQRLSIARVFLKNPQILILDEATSALDNSTEIHIQEALERLSVGRTTIVVAHRLSTIKNADQIAVIEKGKVVELGNHESLLNQNGKYADLYHLQFKLQ